VLKCKSGSIVLIQIPTFLKCSSYNSRLQMFPCLFWYTEFVHNNIAIMSCPILSRSNTLCSGIYIGHTCSILQNIRACLRIQKHTLLENKSELHLFGYILRSMGFPEEQKAVSTASRHVRTNARAYCETTTIHGFRYWVNAPRGIEKLFWVIVVITGFACASLIISAAFLDWQNNPGVVSINSFSKVRV
jgi:hypothetical protein